MYKGYPICLEEEDGTVSVLRLKLEPIEEVRLHEEVLPDVFRKICKAICEEQVLQDPIFIDEKSKVILDGMHRAAALLKLKSGECKQLFFNPETNEYTRPECQACRGKFRNLEYILCCAVDYQDTKAVKLKKWYRGVDYPFDKIIKMMKSTHTAEEHTEEEAYTLLDKDAFTILTDGKKYYTLSGTFKNILDKYLALREVEQLIRERGGKIIYCADEEAFHRMEEGEFSFLMMTPTITRKDVQTFSRNGFPQKGEVFPPKSTRHRLSARPLKVNIPLRLLERGDYALKQEQLKVFLRRKRMLIIRGKLEQYLEKDKILFGEPGELKEMGYNPHLWACEFPKEFYQIKYEVDEFVKDVSTTLISNGMELDYVALIRETNRVLLIISNVTSERKIEELLCSLMRFHFPDYAIKNLFGQRDDESPVWMVPMEDYTPSRAYFERNERLVRQLVRIHKALQSGKGRLQRIVERIKDHKIKEVLTYAKEDLLILFAFHVLGKATKCKVFEYLHEDMGDHEAVFSRIETLVSKGLIEKGEDYTLTRKGRDIIQRALTLTTRVAARARMRSSNKFTTFLKKIDKNVPHVIKPDGRKDAFHIGSILESLTFTDMGWRAVSDVLDRVAEEFRKVDFASSDELTSFVRDYLEEKHPLTNIPFRYDYFINSRDYLFLRDETVVSLSRHHIEEDLNQFIPDYLEMTAGQKSQLSNMVYEGVRLLTIPLIKELYESERIVVEKKFLIQVEEFLIFCAVPVLKKLQNKDRTCVVEVMREKLEEAQMSIGLSQELLNRNDAEFLKYYIAAVDFLTESVSIGLGRVPFFDVFGRLTQLTVDVKNPSTKMVFLCVDDPGTFLRHLNTLFRRSTSLLDQWRSLCRKYSEEAFLKQCDSVWRPHLKEVAAVIEKLQSALKS